VLAGKQVPALLDRSTLGALARFARYKLISNKDHQDLTAAYLFLRDVEHKLQMVHDLQTHALPDTREELERCAIRMGYHSDDQGQGVERFHADHRRHTEVVNRLFRALFSQPTTSVLLKATLRLTSSRR